MLILTPDLEIPFIDPNDQDFDKLTLRERAEVAVKTINILGSAGAEFEDDYEDLAVARDVIRGEEKLDEKLLSKNPGAIAHVQRLLTEYEEQVVVEAARLRNYVTNKLILESDDNDARIRIRALELLGKISDVGLFTEKSEITYKTKSDEELDEELEKRIQSILSKNTIDITPEEVFGSARERSPFTKQNSQPQAAQ
jgi:hypothetical protein